MVQNKTRLPARGRIGQPNCIHCAVGSALHRRYASLVELELTPLRFDNPHDAVNGTYGGQGKAVAVDPSAALLFERPPVKHFADAIIPAALWPSSSTDRGGTCGALLQQARHQDRLNVPAGDTRQIF